MNKLDHIQHIDDSIDIKSVSKTLESIVKKTSHISLKYDGSVSVLLHKDFIATKSYFNKTPVYYTNEQDILQSKLSDDLKDKLLHCKKYMNFKENYMIQGDILYSDYDVANDSFTPNTITYTIPNFDFGKMGICWHTKYQNDVVLPHNYIVNNDNIRMFSTKVNPDDMNFDSSTIFDVIGIAHSISTEYDQKPERDFYGVCIDEDHIPIVQDIFSTFSLVEYKNTYYIHKNEYPYLGYHGYISWVKKKMNAHLDSLKSERGKIKYREYMNEWLQKIHDVRFTLVKLFMFQSRIEFAKILIMNDLNKYINNVCPVKTTFDGETCDHEGFVVNNFKLINRLEFTRNNYFNRKKKTKCHQP